MAKETEQDKIIGKILDLLTVLGVDSESEDGLLLTEKIRDAVVSMGE